MGKLVKIGRHNDNDIVINDPSVARHHLEIFWDDEGNVFVTDLNSTNGTTINGQRLSGSMLIGRSDIIKIGNVPALPWRTYFTDQVVAAVNNSASQRQGLSGQVDSPVQEQNSYLIHYIVGFLVAALIVVGFFIFKDDLFSSENDKGKDNTSEEQQNESNQNGNQRNGESGESGLLLPDLIM